MTEVTADHLAAARRDGAFVLDVREPSEYVQGHVPGARLVPLDSVPRRLHELPARRPVYVVCASGNRSARATRLLRDAGWEAYSLGGGTSGWISAGHPVVTGPRADGA